MILLELFLNFLLIGAVTFGGGYAMIPLIQDIVVGKGWLTAEELLNFIAISESTPGPFAVNIATYIGSKMCGLGGAIITTIGVILPAFLIIILVVSIMKNLLKYKPVNTFLIGVRPTINGVLFGTAITMVLLSVFGVESVVKTTPIDYRSIMIFAIIALIYIVTHKLKKKSPSPILLIIISACLGMVLFSI